MCYRSSSIPFILLALSLLAVSCGSRSGHTGQMPPMEIEIAVAEFDLLYTRRSFISQINSDNEVVVEPRVSGFLVARHYKKGMPVRKGQLIFEIDDSEYYTALLSAQAALESSRALALEAKNNFDRAVPLAKINAISGTQLDQYTAQYAASEADVKSARQALRNAQLNLGYTKIYAQIDGIIESSNGSVGDYVGPGTQIPTLTTIMNIDTVQVPIAIPMTQFLRLDSNRTNIYDNAELLSEIVLYEADGTRYPLFGKYDYTRTAVSSATGTIVLIVRFPNPSYRTVRACRSQYRGEAAPCTGAAAECRADSRRIVGLGNPAGQHGRIPQGYAGRDVRRNVGHRVGPGTGRNGRCDRFAETSSGNAGRSR